MDTLNSEVGQCSLSKYEISMRVVCGGGDITFNKDGLLSLLFLEYKSFSPILGEG